MSRDTAPAFDAIVVGAGSAGCALASRLSADPRLRVLLIEGGPARPGLVSSALVAIPRGVARTLGDPAITQAYRTDWACPGGIGEAGQTLVRGRMLGGSSAVNGLIYHRGQPADYDRWEALGNPGWGWASMLPYFLALEDHALPATPWRGRGGAFPLRLMPRSRLGDALIAAGGALGLPRKEEPNLPEQRGVGYLVANIDARGRRVSAARAFLTPEVRRRPNLRILTDTRVARLRFEGRRCVGIVCVGSAQFDAREVILCAGAYESPLLLQASGIGPAAHLAGLGVAVVRDNANVGRNLRDHWQLQSAFDLRKPRDSENGQFRGPWLVGNLARYAVTGGGPFAAATHHVAGFVDTEGEGRATLMLVMGPYTTEIDARGRLRTAATPTMNFFYCALRSTSEGELLIADAERRVAPIVRPNYLATEHDRRVSLAGARFVRRLAATAPLAALVRGERAPTAGIEDGDALLAAASAAGSFSAHSCGTCRMGPESDPRAVVDARLRVHGIAGVRVADGSFFPEMVSANTNAPIMAAALRAADLIGADLRGQNPSQQS